MENKIMKAAAIDAYGPAENLKVREMKVPEFGENQLLVKVFAASVNPVDTYFRKGMLKIMTGNKFPLIPGRDLAGVVEEAGGKTIGFKKGDKIYAVTEPSKGGSYAEYAVVNYGRAAIMPHNLYFEEAAAVPVAGVTALQSLRRASPEINGKDILIYGATGGVGSFAVQVAKALGASVTAVCSVKNADIAKKMGADEVVGYENLDFLKTNQRYDVVIDFVGNRTPGELTKVLKKNGMCVTPVFRKRGFFAMVFNRHFKTMMADINTKDLDWYREKIESHAVKSLIDTVFTLDKAAQAQLHVETKHSRGKTIIKIR